jgi:hypothetical protein
LFVGFFEWRKICADFDFFFVTTVVMPPKKRSSAAVSSEKKKSSPAKRAKKPLSEEEETKRYTEMFYDPRFKKLGIDKNNACNFVDGFTKILLLIHSDNVLLMFLY